MSYKGLISFSLLIFLTQNVWAQPAILTVVSKDKKPFYIFVDGLKENETPKPKVRIKNLSEGNHHVKIIFEARESSSPQAKIDLPFGKELLYEIKFYKSGDRTWYALAKLDQKDINLKPKKKKEIDSLSTNELTEASQKTDSIFDANLPDPVIATPKDSVRIATGDTLEADKKIETSDFNCTPPLHPNALELLLQKLKEPSTEEARIKLLKGYLKKNCVSSIQIMELLQTMQYEVSKLELATYAYKYCFDPKNYYLVEDVFEYESSIEKLHNALYEVN